MADAIALTKICLVLFLLSCWDVPIHAGIVAKSSISQCSGSHDVKKSTGEPCSKMLIVALTVTGDEGKSRFMQADVSKVVDNSNPMKAKNVQLKNPLRLRIRKSPILIHYDMEKVATFSHNAYEQILKRKKCRSDWYAYDRQLGCGRQYTPDGKKIFDSQGVCCWCRRRSRRFSRAMTYVRGSTRCMGSKAKKVRIAHCMRLSPIMDHAYDLQAPRLIFDISVDIEKQEFSPDNKTSWKKLSTLNLGPHRHVQSSETHMIKAEYIGDFHPDTFSRTRLLLSKYVVIPDLDDIGMKISKDGKVTQGMLARNEIPFLKKKSDWLAVDQKMVALNGGGNTCNKMGVSYSDFRWQTGFCENKQDSCLYMQAHNLYWNDRLQMRKKKKPQYMLHSFGKLHSITDHKFSMPTGHLQFKATRIRKSMVVITLAADDLKIITNLSPGRIVEAFIEPFQALMESGKLVVVVQNTGTLTASYQIAVVKCSAGIDYVPTSLLTLTPQQTSNISFTMHSIYSVGKINKCDVELLDQNGERKDNMTVMFETEDTCFCYKHCGCACGNQTDKCPPPPKYHKNDSFVDFNKKFKHFIRVANFLKGNFGKFILLYWFIWLLCCLGVLKVLHMFMTGQVDYPAVSEPSMMAAQKGMEIMQKFSNEWCPAFERFVCGTTQRCCLCCFSCIGQVITGEKDHAPTTIAQADYEKGWRRPKACNGMCSGAKAARKIHRKQMRINKRKGTKKETVWYQKKYECTCKVKDTMPCCQICTGLFFFFYLPLLPLFWTLEFLWEYLWRRWRRYKRKKRYRELKADQAEKEKGQYLSVDQYTRGKVEKQILGLNKQVKKRRTQKKGKDTSSSSSESSDTTDEDQAMDIDELLNPGDPVYFNYANLPANRVPSSLKSPGKNFSIKGRITEENRSYVFGLYHYTQQIKIVVSNKAKPLIPPKLLEKIQFRRKLNDGPTALKLVTLYPLFTVLNGQPKK